MLDELIAIQSEIQAILDEYDNAVLRDDPVAVLHFYQKWTISDFEERDNPPGHVTTQQQMLQIMEQVAATGSMLGGVRLVETSSRVDEVALKDDGTAAVIVTAMAAYFQIDTPRWHGAANQDHRFDNTGQWKQTWVRTEAGWRLQVNRKLGGTMLVDGKPVTGTEGTP